MFMPILLASDTPSDSLTVTSVFLLKNNHNQLFPFFHRTCAESYPLYLICKLDTFNQIHVAPIPEINLPSPPESRGIRCTSNHPAP
jgi:hypothetical protein